jgi:hypothetical protein
VIVGFNLNEQTMKNNLTKVVYYQRLVEAFKHGYAKRTEFGDPEFLAGLVDIEGVMMTLFLFLIVQPSFSFSSF